MSDPREPLPAMNRRMLVAGFCVYSLFLLFPIFALLVSRETRAEGLRAELAKVRGEAREAHERLDGLEMFLKTAEREQIDARIGELRASAPLDQGR